MAAKRDDKGRFLPGPGNPLWRGGAMQKGPKGRYTPPPMVDCPPEFETMARADGKVAEHRLAMARRIGRALFPWEVVHHRDHDSTNPAPDNLELWPSNHAHKLGEHGKLLRGCYCRLDPREDDVDIQINPDLEHLLRPLEQLHPNERNPRHHPEDQLARLEGSFRTYGIQLPILVLEDGTIVAGHARFEVAQRLGVTAYPCITFGSYEEAQGWLLDPDKVEAEAEGFMVMDNRVAELADWHDDLLEDIILSQQALDREIEDALGFTGDDLAAMFDAAPADTAAETEIPDEPDSPVSADGTIWELGDHLLLCGDCRYKNQVEAILDDPIQTTFTDPPYGISYTDREGRHDEIVGDDLRDDELVALLEKAFKWAVRFSADDAAYYVWHSPTTRNDFAYALGAAGLVERQYLIWVKETFTLGGADYQHGYEPCFYLARAGQKPKYIGDRRQSTVWRWAVVTPDGDTVFDLGDGLRFSTGKGQQLFVQPRAPKGKNFRMVRLDQEQRCLLAVVDDPDTDSTAWAVKRDPGSSYQHPTQKPVGLARRALRNSTEQGEIVYDPFAGSGSTLIACDGAGRRARCVEIEPGYCDVIVERWQDLTGGKAKRR